MVSRFSGRLKRHRPKARVMTENELARQYGITKRMRQYAKRYGRVGREGGLTVLDIVQMRRQYPAQMLDHWRDRVTTDIRFYPGFKLT
jgi:hypothetical protein